MLFPYSQISKSESETSLIAEEFASILIDGTIVILNGDLGAGKTFFIKRVLQKFGYTNANSPTFAIVNEYRIDRIFYHFDFYRIKSVNELLDIGFEDYLNDDDAIIFIEWGNLFSQILPEKRIEVKIKINSDSTREIFITKHA